MLSLPAQRPSRPNHHRLLLCNASPGPHRLTTTAFLSSVPVLRTSPRRSSRRLARTSEWWARLSTGGLGPSSPADQRPSLWTRGQQRMSWRNSAVNYPQARNQSSKRSTRLLNRAHGRLLEAACGSERFGCSGLLPVRHVCYSGTDVLEPSSKAEALLPETARGPLTCCDAS
jgi:hypothetical protein